MHFTTAAFLMAMTQMGAKNSATTSLVDLGANHGDTNNKRTGVAALTRKSGHPGGHTILRSLRRSERSIQAPTSGKYFAE